MKYRTNAMVLALLLAWPPCSTAAGPETDVTRAQKLLPQFEPFVEAGLTQTSVPGVAIAIVYRDQVVYLKGFGVRKVGGEDKVDADTVFQLASVSKPLASTVIAALVSQGKIRWDDKVCERLPWFQLADPWITREVTLADLLSHRSGLPDHAGDALEDLGYDRREVLSRLRFLKPGGRFRDSYAYTNFGFTAAGEAAAQAVGKPWEDLCAEALYRPLGMKNTSSRFADYDRAANKALAHVREGGKMVPRYTRQPDAQAPAGGVSSTARDMAQWLRLHLANGQHDGKPLIAADALRESHKPHVLTHFDPADFSKTYSYGLGWSVGCDDGGRLVLRHSGAFSLGVRSQVLLVPGEQLGLAILANGFVTGLPEALSTGFLDLYHHGKLTRDWVPIIEKAFAQEMASMVPPARNLGQKPTSPRPPLAVAAYVGKYRNDYYGLAEVTAQGDKLMVALGPLGKTKWALTHWDRDTFTYLPEGENANGTSAVLFRIGGDGQAEQILLDGLSGEGFGGFDRVPGGK